MPRSFGDKVVRAHVCTPQRGRRDCFSHYVLYSDISLPGTLYIHILLIV